MGDKKRIVKYKCPYCDYRLEKPELVRHVEDKHEDMIPEGYSALRLVFDYINKKPQGYNGKCCICGKESGWDETKGRYNKLCSNPKCKEEYIKRFEDNMQNKLGHKRISETEEGLKKMLANRKISGKYKFKDGGELTYCGSYELNCLKFMDTVMQLKSRDILTPGPVVKYVYKNEEHLYLTDIYYIPYNLVIEVKDGGDNPNKRNMVEYREKQIAKEEYIIKHTDYNYLRLTNNSLDQLLAVFADLKLNLIENTNDRVIHINEAMNALTTGYMPGFNSNGSVYIVNYLQNNVFSGLSNMSYGISDNIKLTNLICRDKEGKLRKAHDDFLDSMSYSVYQIDNCDKDTIEKKIKDNLDEFVEEGFIYETVFNKKLYSYDQIECEPKAKRCLDYKKSLSMLSEVTENYLFEYTDFGFNIDDCVIKEINDEYTIYLDINRDKYIIKNNEYGFYIERDNLSEEDKDIFVNILKEGGK